MKRVHMILFVFGFVFGLVVLEASAQSVVDLARQQREARSRRSQAGPLITTEAAKALRPGATLSIAGSVSPSDAGTTETPSGQPAGQTGDGAPARETTSRSEEEQVWRAAFAEVREQIQRAEARIELGEQELQELNVQLLTRSDIYNREVQIPPMIEAKEVEIAGARNRLEEANQALRQLQTDLRQAGLPAGWGR